VQEVYTVIALEQKPPHIYTSIPTTKVSPYLHKHTNNKSLPIFTQAYQQQKSPIFTQAYQQQKSPHIYTNIPTTKEMFLQLNNLMEQSP
jgi:tRNA A22 N-methylase